MNQATHNQEESLNNAMSFVVVVPAAGVGKRMLADRPKQYLTLNSQTVLEHTVTRLLAHPQIDRVILSLADDDHYFQTLSLANDARVDCVIGGKERVASVLAGLKAIDRAHYPWVLVHDAARPCVSHHDISKLIRHCLTKNAGAILAAPVKDTMKRGDQHRRVLNTVAREQLWHALTPQMYRVDDLVMAIEQAIAGNIAITDESSAIEYANLPSYLVEGSLDNIKITHPDDLALAAFILSAQQEKI